MSLRVTLKLPKFLGGLCSQLEVVYFYILMSPTPAGKAWASLCTSLLFLSMSPKHSKPLGSAPEGSAVAV